MANTTFYERGNAYHDSAGNPAIIKNGNELTFTEHFNAGGGGTPYTPPAYSTEEVNTGEKWIDGKDIYKLTIDLVTKLNLTTDTAVNVIPDPNIDTLISNSGAIYNSSTSKNNNPVKLAVNNGYVKATGITTGMTELRTIVIYYTKTTPTRTTTKKTSKKG